MTTADIPTFSALLRHYRVQAGLTQEALAERAHLSRRAIAALEQGINRVPRAATVALLTQALALSAPARAALVAASRPALRTAAPETAASSHTPPLVGRTQELALLARHLAGEGPPLLLLAGEPGIGKSRLLQTVALRGSATGWQVLQAGCARSGGQLPYTPLLQALQRRISSQPAAQQRTALRGCAWLVRLLPELAGCPIEPLPLWAASPEQERRLMFEAVERYLVQAAGPAGTLLLLDDLQWAGADALDLLATLARTSAGNVRIVGAYRDTEPRSPDPLGSVLADLAHAGLVRHHVLSPLAPEEAIQLIHAIVGARADQPSTIPPYIVRRAGGVPFFVVSCAQALCDQGADAAAIPWDVAQGIRLRVATLSPLAQEVLGAMAIAVRRVAQMAVLATVLERPEREVLLALEAAWRARLLDDANGGFRIAHDLIREVLEADLGSARRELLHRRMAEALEARQDRAPAEVLAYHYAHSDVPDRAVTYWEQAGDAARDQAALAAAADYYWEGATHLDRLSRSIEAAQVREKFGAVLHTAAHFGQAIEVLHTAVYYTRALEAEHAMSARELAEDAESLDRLAARISSGHDAVELLEESVVRLRPQLELLAKRGPSRGLANLYHALSGLYMTQGQFPAALEAATQSAAIGGAVHEDELIAAAEHRRAWALMLMGRDEESLSALQAADALASATGNHALLSSVAQLSAWIAEDRGDFARAKGYAVSALMTGERIGDPILMQHALFRLAAQAYFKGEWSEAHRQMERVQNLAERSPRTEAATALELGRLCMVEGAWGQATAHLEACIATASRVGIRVVERTAQCLLAERDLLEDRPRAALARLLPLLDREGMQERMVTNYVLPVLAWAYLALDGVGQAAETIAGAIRRQREGQYRFGLVAALRIQAQVALRQGDRHGAEKALEEGLILARAMPYPHSEGRLLEVYGAVHLACGEMGAARERLEAALVLFRGLGARKDGERIADLLSTISSTGR